MKKKLLVALKNILLVVTFFGGLIFISSANAQITSGISGIADHIRHSFVGIAKLITSASFLAGLGFAVASIFKFKAHKDNPQQMPIGTPIAMLIIAIALMFIVYLFAQLGVSVFGASAATTQFGTLSGVSGFSGVL